MRGLERGDKTFSHGGPSHIVPLDRDDDRAVVGLTDRKTVEMGDARNRGSVVQVSHDLSALLKGEAIVFILAVGSLEDKLALAGNVPELTQGGDGERLS